MAPFATDPGGHWRPYRIDAGTHSVEVYVAHDSEPKPVVLLIQGSGCAPLMTVEPNGRLNDTTLFADLIAPHLKNLHFVLIAKRGVEPLRFTQGMAHEQKVRAFEAAEQTCSPAFVQHATKQSRVADVVTTMRALSAESWVQRILLAGHSEGTHVATGVLRAVTDVPIVAAGLFASAGPVRFYTSYAARGGDPDRLREVAARMRMLHQADDNLMYDGLPARRWKTFWLESTPIEDVRESIVPLFVAQGRRDETTLSADLFVLEALRQQPTRPVRYVVVHDGDHAFATPDGKSTAPALFEDFIAWSLSGALQTGITSLK